MSYSQDALDEFYNGDIDKANELIKKAIENDDDDTLFNLGDNLLEMGQSVQAKEIFEDLLEKNPDADELRTRLAEIAVSDGNNDAAIDYLSVINPDSYAYAEALLTSADVYQSMGMYEVSEQKLLEAIRLYPDEDVIKFALAELYFAQGNFEKAINLYELLLDNDISELSGISIHERLGDSLAGTGKFEEAIIEYNDINRLLLNEDILYKKGSLYYQTNDLNNAQKTLNELIDLNHDYAPAYYLLANVLYDQNKYEESYRTAVSGLKFNEYNLDLYRILIKSAKKTKFLKDAIEQSISGINKVEEPNELKKIISDYYIEFGDYEQAISIINSGNETDSDDPYLFWNLAKANREIDDINEARKNILLAYNDLQDNPDFLKDLVLILRDSVDLTTAKDALNKYLKLVPDDDYMRTIFDD
ncbi:tetratricopeptide repeat protein [Companilactobacillus sp. DQM5]|uniref:tetratricopeptide repeat protein n=1 Tax=Companilactobacillus sp. DQM5 TaxID=3463359 RepID=UPI004059FED4